MTPSELQSWLCAHAQEINGFTDLEFAESDEETLVENLRDYWFRDPNWNEPGHRFLPLGMEGTGGEIAVWLPAGAAPRSHVVFFGSEGGSGVLAMSPAQFAQSLSYGAMIEEYPTPESASRLSVSDNWMLADGEPEDRAEAQAALASYRAASEARFGPLAAFQDLVAVPAGVQTEFRTWVLAVQERANERKRRNNGVRLRKSIERSAKRRRTSRQRA